MASDGGVVAEDFVFDNGFAGANCIVEVGLVIDGVAVARRHGVGFAFFVHLPVQSFRLGMVFVPLLQILITQSLRPSEDRVALGLGPRVLRFVGEGRRL